MRGGGLVPDTAAFTGVTVISHRVSTGEANGSAIVESSGQPLLAVAAAVSPVVLHHAGEHGGARPATKRPRGGRGAGHAAGSGAEPRAGGRIPAEPGDRPSREDRRVSQGDPRGCRRSREEGSVDRRAGSARDDTGTGAGGGDAQAVAGGRRPGALRAAEERGPALDSAGVVRPPVRRHQGTTQPGCAAGDR